MKLTLSGVITRDGAAGCYLSECPQLRIASAGNTVEEAKEALHDAVMGFLQVCSDRGTLVEVLRDRGVVLDESPLWFNIPTEWSPNDAIGRSLQAV